MRLHFTKQHIKYLEAKVQELDILNDELTDLYNKHMRSWAEREKALDERILSLENELQELREETTPI